jgi:hypothetical protein
MAADDEYQPDDFDRGEHQESLYELIGFFPDTGDITAHDLFWQVMYNDELTADQREDYYEQLEVYLYDSYGLDFEDLWDWEDFRDWYANQ